VVEDGEVRFEDGTPKTVRSLFGAPRFAHGRHHRVVTATTDEESIDHGVRDMAD
jgi:hypothetical protein